MRANDDQISAYLVSVGECGFGGMAGLDFDAGIDIGRTDFLFDCFTGIRHETGMESGREMRNDQRWDLMQYIQANDTSVGRA